MGLLNRLRLGNSSKNEQFAVLGLGRFGRAVALTMGAQGYDILAIDRQEERVTQILLEGKVTHALALDVTDAAALRESGVFEMDTVVVAIGNYVEESVIATLHLKEAGVARVVAKASSDIHRRLLEKVGADRVVFPEHEMGCALGRSLSRPGILEQFELGDRHGIVEVVVPKAFDGKSIGQLQLRRDYGVTVLAISQAGSVVTNPLPDAVLVAGAVMVVLGEQESIDRLLV
ncbi:MAG: TrkA family potassium uptake protein [Alkalinema sp. RU_4_3]|nr:TrkA family potassium uptake protein [Alkalinema sp. RU_4_3]